MLSLASTRGLNVTSANHVTEVLPSIGTWMAGLQKRDKIDDYLVLMHQEKSLDRIKEALSINKKTAFDWRHKILAALQDDDDDDFTGITESDETFF